MSDSPLAVYARNIRRSIYNDTMPAVVKAQWMGICLWAFGHLNTNQRPVTKTGGVSYSHSDRRVLHVHADMDVVNLCIIFVLAVEVNPQSN